MLSSAMSGKHLLYLPLELAIEILKLLDYRTLLRCGLVCRSLRATIQESLELRYIIELAADGLVDIPTHPLSTVERLRLLLDRRQRWRILDWIDKIHVPMPGACQAYELVGGVLAKTMGSAFQPGSYHFHASWLPSRTQSTRSIVRESLGVPTKDFAIDPSQDLIALVDAPINFFQHDEGSIMVHLRTISTDVKHPNAKSSELETRISFGITSSFIQIVDDVVGMFYWVEGPGVIIWNWQTAEILVHCKRGDLPTGTWDFGFLSNRAFMVTSASGAGSIDVYSFVGHSAASPSPPQPPTRCATLHLPPLQEGEELQQFTTHTGPYLHAPMPDRAFETSRESRVHLMSLHYGERGLRYHMFIHNNFLLSFVGSPDGHGQVVPWESWGPKNTRFSEHNIQFQWLRYVHGTRVVLPPVLLSWPSPQCTLSVIDFNVHPKRLDDPVLQTTPQGVQGKFEIVEEPSVIPAEPLFRQDVITSMPYSVASRPGQFHYSGFMIDDERLVGMKSTASAEGDMSDVDVYTF